MATANGQINAPAMNAKENPRSEHIGTLMKMTQFHKKQIVRDLPFVGSRLCHAMRKWQIIPAISRHYRDLMTIIIAEQSRANIDAFIPT